MTEFFDKYLSKILIVIIIMGVAFLINNLIDKLIQKTINRKRKKNITTLLVFVRRIKKIVIYGIAVIFSLSIFDLFNSFSITLLSGLGVGTVVLGIAAQESLKNFFGSVAIVSGNPFEVGDFIELSGKDVSGTVEDITMRHTIIRTINNRRVIIPNSEMNNCIIENFNYSDNELVKMVDYEISYESDIDKAIEIIKDELTKLYTINPKGKNKDVEYPKVRVASWEKSGIVLRAWVWGKNNGDVFENIFKLNYNLKKRFDKNHIEIPYPHVNIVKCK